MDISSLYIKHLLGHHATDPSRKFLAALLQSSKEGHLCLHWPESTDLPASLVYEGEATQPKAPIIRRGEHYYLQRNWVYETHIVAEIQRLRAVTPSPVSTTIDAPLLPEQKEAVEKALSNTFSLICGGPGTGKTYTAAQIVRVLGAKKVIVAAPTGKAASHLQTILQKMEIEVEATTLHRLLRLYPGENRLFTRKKIDADLILVDEASMMDVAVLGQLLESISEGTRLVLMGDPDQLPPVEAASLFAEMAPLLGTQLKRCMRTDDLALRSMSEQINRGEYGIPFSGFTSDLPKAFYEALAPTMSFEEISPAAVLQKVTQLRILSALRQGPYGTEELNRQIVKEMERRIQPGQGWAVPIMVTQNAPDLDLYNGTCGVLIGKAKGKALHFESAKAYFPQEVSFRDLPPFEPAFCLSVHKSQGSEFEKVIALFPKGSENFGKEALYTAVTRAKKEVKIFAEETVLRAMLSKQSRRMSNFADRLL